MRLPWGSGTGTTGKTHRLKLDLSPGPTSASPSLLGTPSWIPWGGRGLAGKDSPHQHPRHDEVTGNCEEHLQREARTPAGCQPLPLGSVQVLFTGYFNTSGLYREVFTRLLALASSLWLNSTTTHWHWLALPRFTWFTFTLLSLTVQIFLFMIFLDLHEPDTFFFLCRSGVKIRLLQHLHLNTS